MVNLIANVGIMLMAVYYYLRTSSQIQNPDDMRKIDLLKYIFFEVVLGIIMLRFSILVSGFKLDFRFLLFIFSAKYMGRKITSSTILVLGILRFVWGFNSIAQINMIISIGLVIALPLILKYTQNKWSDLAQLFFMGTFYLTIASLVMYFFISDRLLLLMTVLLWFGSGYVMIFLLHWLIKDLEKLIGSANTDHLTSLQNVRAFYDRLAGIEQEKKAVTLGVIDIDNFKYYNDSFGHDGGDEILKQLARIFEKNKVTDTTFYRIGGEEFAVLIETTNSDKAESSLKKLLDTIASQPFLLPGREPLQITVSIGVAIRKEHETLKKTFQRADVALYKAKANGKNQVVIALPQQPNIL